MKDIFDFNIGIKEPALPLFGRTFTMPYWGIPAH
ncbi:MAG: hypothetical protein CM15mP75_5690 [Flammeovirgaceae bacterium]|nr:MAG: hypothetical protein CM15mP75_5690 [Flammeovirgaceae bacterium]